MRKFLLTLMLGTFLSGCAASSALRYPAARWIRDQDRSPIDMPAKRWRYSYAQGEAERNQLADLQRISSLVSFPNMMIGGKEEALDVNNFDEAPDSTWFTNRLGRSLPSPAEVKRGVDGNARPKALGPLSVLRISRGEVTPELVVQDARGTAFLIAFDHPDQPEALTASSIIGNRLFGLFGYNLPENFIVTVARSDLSLSPDAMTPERHDRERAATLADLDAIWGKIAHLPGGTKARAVASCVPAGIPVGPFSFEGKRSGDANDRIRHEFRRPLRGLRTFCAFTNCSALVDAHTADLFVPDGGKQGHLLHYLARTDGVVGLLNKAPPAQAAAGEGAAFDPGSWSPRFPNPAMGMATRRDHFWAAAILSRLSNTMIGAAVDAAELSDKGKRDELVAALAARRDAILQYWFGVLSPLGEFVVTNDGGAVRVDFQNLAVASGIVKETDATSRWRLQTNKARATLVPWTETGEAKIVLDAATTGRLDAKHLYVIEIESRKAGDRKWGTAVDLFLRRGADGGIALQGIARRYRR